MQTDEVLVTVALPRKLHQALKSEANKSGMKLKGLMSQLLAEVLTLRKDAK